MVIHPTYKARCMCMQHQEPYTASLTVTNFSTGCSYVSDQSIRVINEQINFTATDTTVARNNQSTFTATGMHQPNISSFQLELCGDGGTGTGYSVQHIPLGHMMLRWSQLIWMVCIDTLVKPHYIHVNGPTTNFGVSAWFVYWVLSTFYRFICNRRNTSYHTMDMELRWWRYWNTSSAIPAPVQYTRCIFCNPHRCWCHRMYGQYCKAKPCNDLTSYCRFLSSWFTLCPGSKYSVPEFINR